MAEYANTIYYIDGDEEQFKDLFSSFRSFLLRQVDSTALMGLRYVLSEMRIDCDGIDNRSTFSFLEAERGKFISFRVESPYTREEGLESKIKEKYPKLNIYFEEDATGAAGVLRTNDKDEKYFKGNNYYLDDPENGSEHFDSAEELIEYFKKTYEVQDVENITDVRNYIYHLNEVDRTSIVLYTRMKV